MSDGAAPCCASVGDLRRRVGIPCGPCWNRKKAYSSSNLKDVLIVDREAIKLLAVSELNGVELRNCPAYIREWVTRETEDRNSYENRTKGTGGSEDA